MAMTNVPLSIRLPFFWGEAAPAAQTPVSARQKGLLIGQVTTSNYGVPRAIASADQAASLFGRGSFLHRMALKAFNACPWGDWTAIGVADAADSTPATKTITITASNAGAGTLRVWVGSDCQDIGVTASESASDIATAIAAAFPSGGDYPMTGTHNSGVVTLTAKNKGTAGNGIYVAVDGNIPLPSGVTAVVATGATGATDPTLTSTISAIADKTYNKVAVWLNDLGDELSTDILDRWGWQRQQHGYGFSAVNGTSGVGDTLGYTALLGAASTYAATHWTWSCLSLEPACKTPAFEAAAGLCAVALRSDDVDPGLTIHGLALQGCPAADAGSQFTPKMRNDLLYAGYTTCGDVGGILTVDRAVTRKTQNAYGSRDERQSSAAKIWLCEWALNDLRATMETEYARCRLVNDGPAPEGCATPSMVRGTLIAWYEKLCRLGYAQDPETFAANVQVVRPTGDKNRLDALLPANLADNFEIFAPVLSYS